MIVKSEVWLGKYECDCLIIMCKCCLYPSGFCNGIAEVNIMFTVADNTLLKDERK